MGIAAPLTRPPPARSVQRVQEVGHTLGVGGGAENRPVIGFEHREPVAEIGRVLGRGLGG
jgi:hypothetical protein